MYIEEQNICSVLFVMERCILHIDLDSFFVSVERKLNPDLRNKPVVVGGDPNKRGVVSCASYEAREYGIRAGMALTQAVRICPHAVYIKENYKQYRDASVEFMKIISQFTPDVEPLGLEEAYLDISGFDLLYGPPHNAARKIKEMINEKLDITASIGIATSKVVAKIASNESKPDGLIEVKSGEERKYLAPLSIDKIPFVGKKTEATLRKMGLRTIGDLAGISIDKWKGMLGVNVEFLHNYANGIDNRKVESYGRVKSISREVTFEEDTVDRRFIENTLHRLCERVGADLRSKGRMARSVTLKLRYEDFETVTRSSTLKESINTNQVIYTIGNRLVSDTLLQRSSPVRLIGIGVSNLVEGRQLDMFEPWLERLESLNFTVDRIRRKYGFESIKLGRAFY